MANTTFSNSFIWELQSQYYQQSNINAWRNGEVPHYITSNPFMVKSYAKLILSFFRDYKRAENTEEPFYIIELGAGLGRFSYQLVKELKELCEKSYNRYRFVYVMTDFVEETVQFWKDHKKLSGYMEEGILDIALFNAEKDEKLDFVVSKKTIDVKSIGNPFILIANYFFDQIPQKLFHVNKGVVKSVNIEVESEETDFDSPKDMISGIKLNYLYKTPLEEDYKGFEGKLLEFYKENVKEGHVLIPHLAIGCLDRLSRFSENGFLLITADKGSHRINEVVTIDPPHFAKHGCFSFTANFHALKLHCENKGGLGIFPKNHHRYIDIGCLFYTDKHQIFEETINNFFEHINDFGPDDYFEIKKHLDRNVNKLSISEIFAFIRLSAYDANLFNRFLPRIYELTPVFTKNDRIALYKTVVKIWDLYFPIGESYDLAYEIGQLLMNFDFTDEAMEFYGLSETIYGKKNRVMLAKTFVYLADNRRDEAVNNLKELLENFPDFKPASDMLEELVR